MAWRWWILPFSFAVGAGVSSLGTFGTDRRAGRVPPLAVLPDTLGRPDFLLPFDLAIADESQYHRYIVQLGVGEDEQNRSAMRLHRTGDHQ